MQPRRIIVILDTMSDLPLKKLRSTPAWQAAIELARGKKQGKLKVIRVTAEAVRDK